MTKKSTILKTTLFLVLLSMTQDLYAGACQSIISEETPLKSTSTFQTPSLEEEKALHKKRLKEQGTRFSEALNVFREDMTNAGLNVAVLQNIIIDYLVLSDDIEKIISGNFSIYDMNTEALEALSQINFEYFKENYLTTG